MQLINEPIFQLDDKFGDETCHQFFKRRNISFKHCRKSAPLSTIIYFNQKLKKRVFWKLSDSPTLFWEHSVEDCIVNVVMESFKIIDCKVGMSFTGGCWICLIKHKGRKEWWMFIFYIFVRIWWCMKLGSFLHVLLPLIWYFWMIQKSLCDAVLVIDGRWTYLEYRRFQESRFVLLWCFLRCVVGNSSKATFINGRVLVSGFIIRDLWIGYCSSFCTLFHFVTVRHFSNGVRNIVPIFGKERVPFGALFWIV